MCPAQGRSPFQSEMASQDFDIFVDPVDAMADEQAAPATEPHADEAAPETADIPASQDTSMPVDTADVNSSPTTPDPSTSTERKPIQQSLDDQDNSFADELDTSTTDWAEEATSSSHLDDTAETTHDNAPAEEESILAEELQDEPQVDTAEDDIHQSPLDAPQSPKEQTAISEDDETPKPLRSKRTSNGSDVSPRGAPVDRKASLRTEALIQAAARAVMAKLEKRTSRGSTSQAGDDVADQSILSTGTQEAEAGHIDSADVSFNPDASFNDDPVESRRQSTESQVRNTTRTPSDEGGDSSSQNGADDDVFSDRSARSSIGSFDGPSDLHKFPKGSDTHTERQSFGSTIHSPRMSGVSAISGLSQYDEEEFVPTSRETRLPFRTPSAVRAMQMSSPTPSVFTGASPRSGKRQAGHSFGSASRNSFLQSPSGSTQYSPKGRTTPSRLKPRREEPPLVLLHVTLLPLRWMWGDVLDELDIVDGKALDESGHLYEASQQVKRIRDSWRQLQDCLGDMVFERGVLIPHPQDDYEVLEERLLEALELPLLRRARILDCGHYLGYSNMMEDADYDDDSDDGYTSETSRRAKQDKKHWCKTCKSDINYESLGAGRVFRVKVYASNGLLKANAWEACWKTMERVDVEVEPILELAVQAELERLADIQAEERQSRLQREAEEDEAAERQREAEEEEEAELRREAEALHEAERQHEAALKLEDELRRDMESRQEEEALQQQYTEPDAAKDLPMEEPVLSDSHPHAHVTPQQARVASPTPSAAMQIMRAGRVDSPTPLRESFSARSMRSDSMGSRQHMRRDDGRPRDYYGDAPYPESTPSRSRPDPYVPPAQPHHLENATFMDLFLEAIKVLLRDPKNVAIIVLCVFLGCVMLRPTPQAPAMGYDLAYRQPVKPEVVAQVPVVKVETPAGHATQAAITRAAIAAPVQEDIGAMDTPAVESVYEMVAAVERTVVDSASSEIAEATAAPMRLELPAPSVEAELEAQAPLVDEEPQGEPAEVLKEEIVEEHKEELAEEPEVEVTLEQPTETIVQAPTSAVTLRFPEPPAQTCSLLLADEEAIAPAEEELSQQTDDDALDAPVDENLALPNETGTIDTEATLSVPVDSLVTEDDSDILATAVPETPVTVEEELPVEDKVIDASSPADVEPLVEAPATEGPATEGPQALDQEPLVDNSAITDDATTSLPEQQRQDSRPAVSACSCNTCMDSAHPPSPSSPAVFPFVTEKTTIRVYETITETVLISATAAAPTTTTTETESIVETAIPQTVEETVYETETIRVTVSVPVDAEGAEATAGVRRDEL